MDSSDADVLIQDAYELHWLKIKSLMAIGKKKEATQLLYHFVRIEGEHQATGSRSRWLISSCCYSCGSLVTLHASGI